MTLEFELRPSYGQNRFYPVNQAARAIVVLTGRICLKQLELEALEIAGFTIELLDAYGFIQRLG